jgi:DNA (cytosine-5)-methyltransferase 1
VLVENVSALLTRGLDAVLGTLASYGYVGEWTCLQAADLGAPHLRDRIFIIGCLADAHGEGQSQQEGAFGEVWRRFGHGREDVADATLCGRDEGAVARPSEHQGRVQAGGSRRYVPHADRQGLAVGQVFAGDAREELAALERGNRGPGGCWEFDPADVPESGLGRMVDGISYRLHKGAARNKMLGNAVSPPVGEYLGRRIVKHYLKGA